jgi:squalene synthase HpnC
MSRPVSPITEDITAYAWSVEQAYAYCEALTSRHYENFPVGSRLIPKTLRSHVHAIYAFARVADDYADEPQYPESTRMALLENWESQLLQCVWRKPLHPVFIALKETIERFDLPPDLLRDLLTAFKLDVVQKRYATFSDLLFYCRHSANPVGRLVLLLFGYRDPDLHALSDHICTALQLTNFWQDLLIDRAKGRIYIPQEDLGRFGYSEADLMGEVYNEAFRSLMRHQVERTRDLFRSGQPLCRKVGKDLRFELSLICQGGLSILKMIERNRFNMFAHRPVLDARAWAWLAAKTFFTSRVSLSGG